jgi:hypothetical protein
MAALRVALRLIICCWEALLVLRKDAARSLVEALAPPEAAADGLAVVLQP